MGKLKYEQFDVEKLGVVEKDYVGSGIDTSSSSESLSREFQRRQNGSSRSWGQLILITLLTFLLWMVIFTFIGFLPIQSYNSYFQSPCGQQEQAALSKTPSSQPAGPGVSYFPLQSKPCSGSRVTNSLRNSYYGKTQTLSSSGALGESKESKNMLCKLANT